MLNRFATIVALAATGALGAAASAQTVEFRFVERTGQSFIAIGGDNVLSFSVQGRIVGGTPSTAIGGFNFDIVIAGEPDTFGTLQRERISNNDGTIYTGAPAVNSTIGRGGVAFQYSYLAGIGADFNGLINFSGGTFTNTPGNQEIGKIAAACTGNALTGTPGVDNDGDGNPDTWPGTGVPPNNTIAAISPAVGATYLGVGGGWIDLYRFRYTATNATPRTLTLTLAHLGAQYANQLLYNNGAWGCMNTTAQSVAFTAVIIPVGNPGACCDAGAACSASVDTGCTGTFTAGGSCSPSPCNAACCTGSSCSVVSSSACATAGGQFHAGAACNAGVGNPTTCCEANFDGIGGLQVKDIFDWINAWFAGDPRTDANHSGTLELFDLFTFLNGWFGGCS